MSTEEHIEAEIVLYAHLKDIEELRQAERVQAHEQYQIRSEAKDGVRRDFRVRKTTELEEVRYEFTAKQRSAEATDTAVLEATHEIDEAFYTTLKAMASNAMFKHRYFFAYPKLIGDKQIFWEIDMFYDPRAKQYHPWCKVDLELPTLDEGVAIPETIAAFPLTTYTLLSQSDTDAQVQKKIRTLYDKYFITPL